MFLKLVLGVCSVGLVAAQYSQGLYGGPRQYGVREENQELGYPHTLALHSGQPIYNQFYSGLPRTSYYFSMRLPQTLAYPPAYQSYYPNYYPQYSNPQNYGGYTDNIRNYLGNSPSGYNGYTGLDSRNQISPRNQPDNSRNQLGGSRNPQDNSRNYLDYSRNNADNSYSRNPAGNSLGYPDYSRNNFDNSRSSLRNPSDSSRNVNAGSRNIGVATSYYPGNDSNNYSRNQMNSGSNNGAVTGQSYFNMDMNFNNNQRDQDQQSGGNAVSNANINYSTYHSSRAL